MEGTFHGLI